MSKEKDDKTDLSSMSKEELITVTVNYSVFPLNSLI